MTRRGSLIYYLTAWICGCFFMSLAIWTRDLWSVATGPSSRSREAFGVLFFYFYGLVFGALAVLIGAFLLRRIMALLKCKTPSHWAVAGAILAPALIGGLGAWGVHAGTEQRIEPRLLSFLLARSDDGGSGGMVARDSGGRRDGIFAVPRAARVRLAAAGTARG